MKCKKTHQQCPYALPISAQDGWRFIGCCYPPYKGKHVDEFSECPRRLEQKMDEANIDKYLTDFYHLSRAGKDMRESLSDLLCRAIKASGVKVADGRFKKSILLSGTISFEIAVKDDDITVSTTDDKVQLTFL
jgi:hypothetical protein